MNKHPHEEVILAYYRGEKIEFRPDSSSEWKTLSYDYGSYAPSFRHDHQYRIKPQPPKTHTIELTQQEIETVWVVIRRISGSPFDSARAHTDTLANKLNLFVDAGRGNQLHLWDGISGGMCFSKRLPE